MDFKDIYSHTADSLKLKFLDAIIAHNKDLWKEFIAFTQGSNPVASDFTFEKFLEIVHTIQTGYKKLFEMIDTENPDWENYHPPHSGYIEDWEAYQFASEQEFEVIFEAFCSHAVDKIIEQHPGELMAMLIGLYEATQDAEVIDDVDSFEDINEYLLSEHTHTMNSLIEKLRLSAVSGHAIVSVFEMFYNYCNIEYPGNSHFAGHFEQLLIALAEKADDVEQLLELLNQSQTEAQWLPELVLFLNRKAGNHAEWLQSALKFYHNNVPVAKQLLEYYFETDNKDAFLEIAHELFPTDKYLWAEFLQQYLSPQLDEELFVKVFWLLTVKYNTIEHYNKIREYLTESDLNRLLMELEWNKVFMVQILEVEKRHADIKALVEKSHDDWHYAEMIEPILTVYPEFCFRHIKNKAVNTLHDQRGRDVYQRIATWLSLAQTIPGFGHENSVLIKQLYNHKPNLPALKDEMRKAGLV